MFVHPWLPGTTASLAHLLPGSSLARNGGRSKTFEDTALSLVAPHTRTNCSTTHVALVLGPACSKRII
uniref:Putative secreted protein n=1 Tax=Anopheles darlingi TaxID=43151 RepID=A0A2M4DMW4_ANODA